MRLKGKNALVTGSSRGIGRGIALRFAGEGANVAINYVGGKEAAEDTQRAVEAFGVKAVILPADVSSATEVKTLVEAAAAALGPLDILVNNAGIEKHAPFWDVTESDYDKVLDVNLKGTFFATQAMVRHLMDAGRQGRIINLSSVHEEVPFPNFTAYCMSKGGMRMFTRNLAVELGSLGITVNNIAPGAIETPINSNLLRSPMKLGALLGHIPLARLGQPEDVAGLAVFLASDDAAYVTGSTYYVDGGLSVFYQEQ
jgi:glucose 1-dehydrogenase